MTEQLHDIHHYCIQASRIIRIEEKVDRIDEKLDKLNSVDGTVGKMSKQVERLTTLIENGANKKNAISGDTWKWLGLSILILAAIIAALLGVNIPL